MGSENYVVGGRCLLPYDKFDSETLKTLNRRIVELMERKGYFSEVEWRNLLFAGPFLSLTFHATIDSAGAPLSSKVKMRLHLKSRRQILEQQYFKQLKGTIDEAPHRVTFSFTYGEIPNKYKGYSISIESEPAIAAKRRQLLIKRIIDDPRYREIIAYNTNFVREIMNNLGAYVLVEPRVLQPREVFKSPPIADQEFLEALPDDVAFCLREANVCFESQCFAACSVMLRKTIEVAIVKKFFQTGHEKELFDNEGNEISLTKKIGRLAQMMPSVRRDAEQIAIVKWFGDKGAHDPRAPIFIADIQNNVAPKVRAFLANLELKK